MLINRRVVHYTQFPEEGADNAIVERFKTFVNTDHECSDPEKSYGTFEHRYFADL
jgi:hypothetical protein